MSNTKTPATLYDWSTAPVWANWAATDANGKAYWYSNEPNLYLSLSMWRPNRGCLNNFGQKINVQWHKSLEKRPTDKDREDAAIIELVFPS